MTREQIGLVTLVVVILVVIAWFVLTSRSPLFITALDTTANPNMADAISSSPARTITLTPSMCNQTVYIASSLSPNGNTSLVLPNPAQMSVGDSIDIIVQGDDAFAYVYVYENTADFTSGSFNTQTGYIGYYPGSLGRFTVISMSGVKTWVGNALNY